MPKTFYVGIKGLIIKDNKALFLKRTNSAQTHTFWDLPGGRMEEGESVIDTLTRELREELPTIASITIHELVTISQKPRTVADGQGLMLLVYRVTANLSTITLSDEHSAYRWIGIENIESAIQEAEISALYKQLILLQTIDF